MDIKKPLNGLTKGVLVAALLGIGGFLATKTLANSEARAVQESRLDHMQAQLDRIEDKLNRALGSGP